MPSPCVAFFKRDLEWRPKCSTHCPRVLTRSCHWRGSTWTSRPPRFPVIVHGPLPFLFLALWTHPPYEEFTLTAQARHHGPTHSPFFTPEQGAGRVCRWCHLQPKGAASGVYSAFEWYSGKLLSPVPRVPRLTAIVLFANILIDFPVRLQIIREQNAPRPRICLGVVNRDFDIQSRAQPRDKPRP
jgi:hypothetical protein